MKNTGRKVFCGQLLRWPTSALKVSLKLLILHKDYEICSRLFGLTSCIVLENVYPVRGVALVNVLKRLVLSFVFMRILHL